LVADVDARPAPLGKAARYRWHGAYSASRSPRGRGPFGLSIHYHNRKPVSQRIAEELEATYWESLDQMLARMDVVSVNCPHTPGTYHLLSARRLKLLQPHAILVNTARGEIIDEAALGECCSGASWPAPASMSMSTSRR